VRIFSNLAMALPLPLSQCKQRCWNEKESTKEIASTAIKTFGSIDGVVNYAGIFFTKPFTDYTAQKFARADVPAL
jgi:NAD(P)-dependent dehydrogenase (short-subunit alcohol dehydrogenase family)